MADDDEPQELRLVRSLRSAVRNDASAYSYSILVTVTFAAVQLEVGGLSAARLFLFVLGSTGAFAVIEAGSSRMFQKRLRQERSDVVVLGSALAPLSVSAALGVGVVILRFLGGAPAWVAVPAVTTATYVGLDALQLLFGRVYAEQHPVEE